MEPTKETFLLCCQSGCPTAVRWLDRDAEYRSEMMLTSFRDDDDDDDLWPNPISPPLTIALGFKFPPKLDIPPQLSDKCYGEILPYKMGQHLV